MTLHGMGAIDIRSQYPTGDMSRPSLIRLMAPQARLGHEVTSQIDASLFCVPCPLLQPNSSSSSDSVGEGAEGGGTLTPPREGLGSEALTHAFPPLSLSRNRGGVVYVAVPDRLRKYTHKVVTQCSHSYDVSDNCWQILYDPNLLLYLYATVPDVELVCNFVDSLSGVVRYKFLNGTEGRSMQIPVGLLLLLDQIKMHFEIFELECSGELG